jgi:hypothetical protein
MATQTDGWGPITATGEQTWQPRVPARWTYAASITGTGAVSATVEIYGRVGPTTARKLIGTITLSGTGSDAVCGDPTEGSYRDHTVDVTAISGTGAAVVVEASGGV